MIDLGRFSLAISFFVSIYVAGASLYGVIKNDLRFVTSARRGIYAIFFLSSISVATLLNAFFTDNFQVRYVSNYSEIALPGYYKFTGLWAGQEGSLLFWIWGLAMAVALVAFQNRKERDHRFLPYAFVVLMIIYTFFSTLACFVTSPFELYSPDMIPPDGHGLNPMLQTHGMIFHPPTLLWGYVGFSVPFAFAMAALITRELDPLWIRKTRRWTVLSWVLLSLGNILGSEWAYAELGWGGYWAWDPVENASFIPWLTASAYLHSVMIQERRGMLKVWNMFLVVTTFILTIFGTFLVRSGVLQSVHDFGVSEMGPYFMSFMLVMAVAAFSLVAYRFKDLKSDNQLESFLSRESTFLLNNMILLGLAFATLWGTMFPLISEAVTGEKITVGPPFFNQVNTPLFLVLLIVIGICPLIGWRKATAENLKKNFILPGVLTFLSATALIGFGMRHVYAILFFSFSVFVLVTIYMEFHRGVKARNKLAGDGVLKALGALLWRNKRRYGGYIIHVGIVMVFVGVTGSSAFTVEETMTLGIGESMKVRNYTLRYEGLSFRRDSNFDAATAQLTVFEDGKGARTIRPEKRRYDKFSGEPTSEVALDRTMKEDLFVILASIHEGDRVTIRAIVNPLINWYWLGGIVAFFGGLYVLLPEYKKKEGAEA